MNERIRELAERAFFDNASGQPSDRVYTFSDHKMQQFAELIVEECMSVADLPKNPSGQWGHLESSEVIAKHFGVE